MRRQQMPHVVRIVITEENAILVFGPNDEKKEWNESRTWLK
jgi:hypothetical protein